MDLFHSLLHSLIFFFTSPSLFWGVVCCRSVFCVYFHDGSDTVAVRASSAAAFATCNIFMCFQILRTNTGSFQDHFLFSLLIGSFSHCIIYVKEFWWHKVYEDTL